MPKIYQEETIQMVWDMIHNERLKLREAAKELDTDVATINKIYAVAEKRYGKREPLPKPKIIVLADPPPFVRPIAEYSNTSPYRIARPGLNNTSPQTQTI